MLITDVKPTFFKKKILFFNSWVIISLCITQAIQSGIKLMSDGTEGETKGGEVSLEKRQDDCSWS